VVEGSEITFRNVEEAVEDEENDEAAIKFTVSPESWRFFAYLMFWLMSIIAITVSNLFVKPYLAKGPEDGSTCGPFKRNNPDFGVFPGEGFNFPDQTHLVEEFGYNNICSNWDYSPSREVIATFYPLFEYSLIVYLCLDYLATAIANKRGEIKPWFYRLSQIIFPICIFLCSQFRMIFIYLAYESLALHTAGFLGLQVALVLVALHNAVFVWSCNIAYKQLGGPENGLKHTRIGVIVYLICDIIISIFKICSNMYFIIHGGSAPFTLVQVGAVVSGQVIDWIWMIFNAIIPMFLSFFRSRNEAPLTFVISKKSIYISVADDSDDSVNYTRIAEK